ncbi:hypothetical protein JCM8097_001621 [Rhodosporidiobolus ruineniae]
MPPKLTQPARPVGRYRPGVAPAPVADDDSDEDNDQQQQEQEQDDDDDEDQQQGLTEFAAARPAQQGGKMNVALREVEVDKGGKVKVGGKDEVGRTEMESSEGEYETDSDDEPQPPAKPVFRPQAGAPAAAAEEEDSSEYETDSEEEEAPKILFKPQFTFKRNRTEQKKELTAEEQEAQREAELAKQREASKNLVADSIVRELAEKEAQTVQPDVDDTDGLDPEGEFEAWKLRELMRLKRDKEARYALEKVREEVEARRAMPEELRLKEDTARADKSRKDKPKGQKAFLEKFHHKGVFHQDLDILSKRDYTAPTTSTVVDVSSLPSVMQKRNFGKAHQTKYTHLADQDTSRTNGGWGRETRPGGGAGGKGGGEGCFNCGGPHLKRDCPQLAEGASAGPSASGANSGARDSGYGARAGAGLSVSRTGDERGAEDRFAPGGGGKRGGIGYGAGAGGRRDVRAGDRYALPPPPRRERSRSPQRRRSRSPPRYRDDRDYDRRDDRRGGERRYDDRDRERRRSRSPPPRRRDERDERGGGGRRREDERDRRDRDDYGRDREDKRRRVEYD